jgi:pyruvate,water dikinase
MTPLFADWIIPRLESGFLDGMWRSARVRVPFRYAAVNGWYYNAAPAPSARTLWRVLVDSRGRAPWFLYNVLARVSRNPDAADRAVLRRLEAEWRNEVLPAYRRRVEDAGSHLATASTTDVMTTVDEIAALAGAHLWSLAVVGGSAWKMEVALALLVPASGRSPGSDAARRRRISGAAARPAGSGAGTSSPCGLLPRLVLPDRR